MKSFFVVAALASMASAANLFEKAQMRNGAQIMNGFANIVSKINKDLLMQYKEEIEQHLDSNEKKYMCYGSDKWEENLEHMEECGLHGNQDNNADFCEGVLYDEGDDSAGRPNGLSDAEWQQIQHFCKVACHLEGLDWIVRGNGEDFMVNDYQVSADLGGMLMNTDGIQDKCHKAADKALQNFDWQGVAAGRSKPIFQQSVRRQMQSRFSQDSIQELVYGLYYFGCMHIALEATCVETVNTIEKPSA